MADNFDWSVVIDLATNGGAKTVQDIDQVEGAIRRLSKANELNSKQEDQANRSTANRAKALQNATNENRKSTESINSMRYANYDLAASYGAVSAALTGVGVLATKAFADMESGFSAVERTSGLYGEAFKPLEQDILSLARTLPVATNEIQNFAARGAQMGIATDKIAEFSETIAKFVATSPEVDVNSIAEAFGRLSNLTGTDDFEALASAVAQVGVNSAATDAQIVKTTQEIARATSSTSLAADEVIGLAAAMASLGVAPEAARGVMNQFFTQLDKGAAGMNESLAVAGQIMGITQEEATKLFQTDAGTFFQQFISGLSGVENITVALDAMGLQGQRLLPAFKALAADAERNAAGQSVLAQALRDSNQGFREKTELDRQYAPIADDLNSKFVLLVNSLKELAYTVGGEVAPLFKGFLDVLITVIQGVSDFVNTPVGGFISRMVVAAAGLVAAYAGLRSIIALATASMLAMRSAMGSTAGTATGLRGAMINLAGALGLTRNGAVGAAGGVNFLKGALRGLMSATIIGAVLSLVTAALSDIPGAAVNAGNALIWIGGVIESVVAKLMQLFGFSAKFAKAAAGANNFITRAGESMVKWGNANRKAEPAVADLGGSLGDLTSGLGDVTEGGYDAGDALGGSGGDSLAGGAEKAEKKIRTLLDYASDLSSVMNRAFEIRFGGQTAADAVAKTFNDLRKAAADSAQKIKDIRSEIRSLTADIGVLQSDINTQKYFLSIALEYGDTARAEAIQANLAKLQSDLAGKQDDLKKKQGELTQEQQNNSKALKGNSEAAIRNRDTLRGLVQQYQAQIEALAKSGMSSSQLRKKTEQLRKDFIRQATQLGFNRKEVEEYAKGFDDATFAIDNIPRNVTIDINANPALTALRELQAQAEKAMDAVGDLGGGGVGDFGGGGGGIPSGGFDIPEDAFTIPEEIPKAGGDKAGKSWFDGFWNWIKDTGKRIGEWFMGLGERVGVFAGIAGLKVWTFFSETLPSTLSRWFGTISNWFQQLPAKMGATIAVTAFKVWNFITNVLPSTMGAWLTRVRDWFTSLPSRLLTFATTAGARVWTFVTNSLPRSLSNALSSVVNWLRNLPSRTIGFAASAGATIWSTLTRIGSWLNNALTGVRNFFINLPWAIINTVTNAAANVWNMFANAFSSRASRSRAGRRLLGGGGWAEGGYTGAGHKYEPAGIVHRGEYVIPKNMVNQRTGLPYADALGRLIRGSQPSGSYARGGYVGGAGLTGPVDLSMQSINLLGRAISTNIILDGKMIGDAASRSYARDNRVGAS